MVGRICLSNPQVVPTAAKQNAVLRGAILTAAEQARKQLLDSVAG